MIREKEQMIDTAPIDAARKQGGFLGIKETIGLAARGVRIFDPFSTLVTAGVDLAPGVTLWPGVVLQADESGGISVGADCQLFPGTRVVAISGHVSIGERGEIGEEGGFTIKAEPAGCVITIGDGARLLGGGSLMLDNSIGHGAQVLGPIRMQRCTLGAGGTYLDPRPHERGAVLKGSGVARDIEVPTGMVIQAFGVFSDAPIRQQSYFHPELKMTNAAPSR